MLLETVTRFPPVVDDDKLVLFEVVDDPDDCSCCVVDVDVWEELEIEDDWDVDEVVPVPVAVVIVDAGTITQVAAGDTTYPTKHLTHLKSLVNYWQFNGILLANPNICNKYITPVLLISNVIELEFVDTEVVDTVWTGNDVVLTRFVFCWVVWIWLISWVFCAGKIVVAVGTDLVCVWVCDCWVVVYVVVFKALRWFYKFTCCWYKAWSTQIYLTITNPKLQVSHLPETN